MSNQSLQSVLEQLWEEASAETMNQLLDAIESELAKKDSQISNRESLIEKLNSENQSLTEKIVSMNESDLRLSELEQKSSDIVKREAALMMTIGACDAKREELQEREIVLDNREAALNERVKREDEIVDRRSQEEAERLQKRFLKKWGSYTLIFAVFGASSVLAMGFTSEAFRGHFGAFFAFVGRCIALWFTSALKWSNGWSEGISNAFGNWAVHYLVGGLIGVTLPGLIGFGLFKAGKWFFKHQADKLAALVGLLSLTGTVFLVNIAPNLPVNGVGLWWGINIALIFVRLVVGHFRR